MKKCPIHRLSTESGWCPECHRITNVSTKNSERAVSLDCLSEAITLAEAKLYSLNLGESWIIVGPSKENCRFGWGKFKDKWWLYIARERKLEPIGGQPRLMRDVDNGASVLKDDTHDRKLLAQCPISDRLKAAHALPWLFDALVDNRQRNIEEIQSATKAVVDFVNEVPV